MRTFIIVWIGQAISIIGTSMTDFAFTIWVWELTGQATAITLFAFFGHLPQLLITPIAGLIVDRCNRKYLMIIGDTVSGLLTIIILILHLTNHLQLWHLYVAVVVNSFFAPFQQLAFSASISMLVPKKQYSRASTVGFLANYGSSIIAPALAGFLYIVIGLSGILIIDISTFIVGISTVLLVHIPQPIITEVTPPSRTKLKQDLYFGWRYIAARPSLVAMLVSSSLFWFAHELGGSLYSPMILARTGNDAQVLGSLASAAGIGGVIGALFMSTWGGFQRRIDGMLLGMMGAGLSKMVFGWGWMSLIWIPAQFFSSINFPMLGSSSDSIWLAKIKPELQGRVFAVRTVVVLITSSLAYLLAGLLADYIFEPAMMPEGSLSSIFGWLVGTGKGAGMALLYVMSALGLLLIGLSGYAFRVLRDVEIIVPDYDASIGSGDRSQ